MNNSYIVSGTLFGDEGKGTLVDYLASTKDIKENVRYNGGSQASHTVVNDGLTHKFSQLGSAFLNEDTRTFLSKYTVVNLFNIISESNFLSEKTKVPREEILKRVFVDSEVPIVTPYHKLIDNLREIESKNNRRGSVGSGVSEVTRTFEETGIKLLMSDFNSEVYKEKLKELFGYAQKFYKSSQNKELISRLIRTDDISHLTESKNREYIIRCYENLLRSGFINVTKDIRTFHTDSDIVFEGSQGLLIDRDYGIRPNTTLLNTTNQNGIVLANELNTNIHKIGAISALTSRHGMGVLLTYDKKVEALIKDENQSESYYQGRPRYGWFDAVLTRYANSINKNDYFFLSALDRLSPFKEIKICDSYVYIGQIDEEFKETFEYYKDGNKIIIKNIKRNSPDLRKYLAKTIPLYITIDGWSQDISDIKRVEDLPEECINFIELIEYLINSKISLIGVGPNRNQKLERILK